MTRSFKIGQYSINPDKRFLEESLAAGYKTVQFGQGEWIPLEAFSNPKYSTNGSLRCDFMTACFHPNGRVSTLLSFGVLGMSPFLTVEPPVDEIYDSQSEFHEVARQLRVQMSDERNLKELLPSWNEDQGRTLLVSYRI